MFLTQAEVVKSSIFRQLSEFKVQEKFYVSILFMYTHDWFMSMYGKSIVKWLATN